MLIVASSHEQGQICFRHVLRFLAPKIEAGEFRVADTVNTSRLTSKATGTMLVVKGSDPKRLHGSAPSLTIADELAQWPTPRIAEMLAALRTAAGKIPGSRLLMIGTRPADAGAPVRGGAPRGGLLPSARGGAGRFALRAQDLAQG